MGEIVAPYRVLMMSSIALAAPWNGADKNLARALVEADVSNQYIIQTGPQDVWPSPHVRAMRSARAGAMPTRAEKLRGFGYLLRHIGRADLVHLVASLSRPNPWMAGALSAASAITGTPIIHTVPSVGDRPLSRQHFPGDITVVVSEYTRRLLTDRKVPNVVRIYPPLDERRLRPAVAPEQVAQELALGPRAVLYPAHYGPNSGIREIIQAFACLPENLRDSVLVLACRAHLNQDPAAEAQRVLEWAAEAGIAERVRLLDNVRDMPALISACAVTALVPGKLSSKMDLPMVILEALALGRPVIVADKPPMSEALLGDGGVAVEYGNVPQLTAALARLLGDGALRAHLGLCGRAAALQECNLAHVVQRYQQIYQSAVRRTAGKFPEKVGESGDGQ